MPEYLSPGVYIEESGIGVKPIEGVSTSTAGFLGETERGPTLPKLVTSWLDFQRIKAPILVSLSICLMQLKGSLKTAVHGATSQELSLLEYQKPV